MAMRDYNVDPKRSFMVGDQVRDVELARRAGLIPILVLTGAGQTSYAKIKNKKVKVTANLFTAAKWISNQY